MIAAVAEGWTNYLQVQDLWENSSQKQNITSIPIYIILKLIHYQGNNNISAICKA